MSEPTAMSRRGLMRGAVGATAAAGGIAATSGTAAAEEPDWGPDFDTYNVGSSQDARGQDEVTVMVGEGDDGLAFDPTGVWVDPGTTIVFEWTGRGGDHNAVGIDGPAADDLDSGDPVAEEGTIYEFETTEDHEGITHYVCEPHEAVDMFGAIAVGDVDTVEPAAPGAGGPSVPDTARALGVAGFFAMVATLAFAFFFLKYGGDYERE